MAKRVEMQWSRLERRLYDALREANQPLDETRLKALIVRIDTILASETRRGSAILEPENMVQDFDAIEKEEWDKAKS